jgi:hypothetical protein
MIRFLCVVLTLVVTFLSPVGAEPDKEEDVVTYRDITVPFPLASGTGVVGRLQQQILGVYGDANGISHGFLRSPSGHFQTVLNVLPQDVSAAGIVGSLVTPQRSEVDTGIRGFLFAEGTLHILQVPDAPGHGPFTILTEAWAVTDTGVVVGTFRRQGEDGHHGFLYRHADHSYTVLDGPSAVATTVLAMTPAERALVRVVLAGGVVQHYTWEAGTFTLLPPIPGLPDADIVGHTDSGILAANVGLVGVVWDGEDLHEIDFPGAALTEINGIGPTGKVVWGRYRDSAGVDHGFVATLGGKAAKQRGGARESGKMHATFTREDCGPGSKRQMCREIGN